MKYLWFQLWRCQCTYIAHNRTELPETCPVHAQPRQRRSRIPELVNFDHAGLGYSPAIETQAIITCPHDANPESCRYCK